MLPLERHNINTGSRRIIRQTSVSCIFALLFVLCCCSHNDNTVYADYVDIPSDGWSVNEFCEFNTAEHDSTLFADSSARYNILLTVRHTGECPYSELFLPAVPMVDDFNLLPDTVHMRLDNGSGQWRGSHAMGIYTVTDTILKSAQLPPLFGLRIFHAMPCEKLTGLLSVGLIIQKNK